MTHGIGCGPDGCRPMAISCRGCGGTGWITPKMMQWRVDGVLVRQARLARDLSLREAAKLLGMPASDYSDAEHGRIDPEPVLGAELQAAAVGMLLPPAEAGAEEEVRPGPAEDPWDISMCYRSAGQFQVNASQYARYFEIKYGRSTSDHRDADVTEERALFRGLESDADRARRWTAQVTGLTEEVLLKARRRQRQGQLELNKEDQP